MMFLWNGGSGSNMLPLPPFHKGGLGRCHSHTHQLQPHLPRVTARVTPTLPRISLPSQWRVLGGTGNPWINSEVGAHGLGCCHFRHSTKGGLGCCHFRHSTKGGLGCCHFRHATRGWCLRCCHSSLSAWGGQGAVGARMTGPYARASL